MLYVIGGPPRSGKTSIRKILLKEKISGIDTDLLRSSLSNYPKLKNKIGWKKSNKENSKNMKLFLEGFIEEFIKYRKEDFILEGDVITINLAKKYKKINNIRFIFIGYPRVNIQKKFKEIRKFEKKYSWTKNIKDEELEEKIKSWISISQKIEKECILNNIKFINISSISAINLKKIASKLL